MSDLVELPRSSVRMPISKVNGQWTLFNPAEGSTVSEDFFISVYTVYMHSTQPDNMWVYTLNGLLLDYFGVFGKDTPEHDMIQKWIERGEIERQRRWQQSVTTSVPAPALNLSLEKVVLLNNV